MALPQLLLVDDSEAILAYERAALGDAYALTTAKDGIDALDKLRSLTPEAIVLDLSMPRMDGEELLGRLRDDDVLREVPVLLVSTESERARTLAASGVVAGFLAKPIEARALRAAVEKMLDEARWRRSRAGLAVLRVDVGPLRIALPLSSVSAVVAQPLCSVVAGGPSYLREMFELEGAPVLVLDLARRLGVDAKARYIDRRLVVVRITSSVAQLGGAQSASSALLALAVDDVLDPEVVPADAVIASDKVGGAALPPLDGMLIAMVRSASANAHGGAATSSSSSSPPPHSAGALIPVIKPDALLSPNLVRELADALRERAEQARSTSTGAGPA